MQTKDFYRIRFSRNEVYSRNLLWVYLCEKFFQKYIDKDSTVMDIGAGYCEFINNISCKNKIAVDINSDTKKYADKDVLVIDSTAEKIPSKYNNKIDVVFMSNFLEHIEGKDEVLVILRRVQKLLKKGGKLLILQPNIDLVKTRYWDFFDHKVQLNLPSLTEGLNWSGFEIKHSVKRFLPYTTKLGLPQDVFLLKIYLFIPSFLRPFAGQSFVYAESIVNAKKMVK